MWQGHGIVRWLRSGRHGPEAYVYVLHRLTGLALLAFLCLHVIVTSTRLLGEQTWDRVMAYTHLPPVRAMEYLVFAAFAFHALNGIRLLLVELGVGSGRPGQPVYPYRSSVRRQRPLLVGTMLAAALLIALGGFELLQLTD
jgi:succinate dehydrogenase / fumarate reductase cytochrome b subunit